MPRSSFVVKITGIAPEVRLAHYVRATPYGKLYVCLIQQSLSNASETWRSACS
jgi:hypothetical protein